MNLITFKSLFLLFSASLFAQNAPDSVKTLDDFQSTDSAKTWLSVNDSAMGGVSKGGSTITKDHHLVFKGKISLENNGGFSSIRTNGKTWDLTKYEGIELRIKGDGRKYYLTARSGKSRMLAFWSPIQPAKNEWTVIRVPFDSFYATSFGRKIPVLTLQTNKINSVGFMLYDKAAGPFSIEVDSIMAYGKDEKVKP